jgi:hypothetical protein
VTGTTSYYSHVVSILQHKQNFSWTNLANHPMIYCKVFSHGSTRNATLAVYSNHLLWNAAERVLNIFPMMQGESFSHLMLVGDTSYICVIDHRISVDSSRLRLCNVPRVFRLVGGTYSLFIGHGLGTRLGNLISENDPVHIHDKQEQSVGIWIRLGQSPFYSCLITGISYCIQFKLILYLLRHDKAQLTRRIFNCRWPVNQAAHRRVHDLEKREDPNCLRGFTIF